MPLRKVRVASAAVTIDTPHSQIVRWCETFFEPWWTVAPALDRASNVPGERRGGIGTIVAELDADRYDTEHQLVVSGPHHTARYGGFPVVVAHRSTPRPTVLSPTQHLVYLPDHLTGRLCVVGTDLNALQVVVARLVRELVEGQLEAEGWTLTRAAAASRGSRAILALGPRGTGKTATVLALARAGTDWALLADERVFLSVSASGSLRVLPWAGASAIGLGLLADLGLDGPIREQLRADAALFPGLDPRVREALLNGRRDAVHDAEGRELKVPVLPAQLTAWLGIRVARAAEAAVIIYPHVDPGGGPHAAGGGRALCDGDFFLHSRNEDRRPSFLPALSSDLPSAGPVRARLAGLPSVTAWLARDHDANTALLTAIADVV